MNEVLFLKAVLIGFCIAAPVGPCGLLCISRSLQGGFRAGIASGLGVTLADAIYATLGVFGIAAMLRNVEKWAPFLRVGGALFLLYLGVKIALSSPAENTSTLKTASHSDFISAFLITLANPLTIFAFIAIFAGLGVTTERGTVILGTALGSLSWWLLLSWLAAFFGKRLRPNRLTQITRLMGWIIAAMGLAALLTIRWSLCK